MTGDLKGFGQTTIGLARNPLGIIALFIVLVYGLAAMVTAASASSSSFSPSERLPLVYFLVVFPCLVLAVFTWLVIGHSQKLFGPGDYKDEANFVKMQLQATALLAVASAKSNQSGDAEPKIEQIVEAVHNAVPSDSNGPLDLRHWTKHILWVDDNPNNNTYVREAFEAFGYHFTLALSTKEALSQISKQRFAAIISDMGRSEGSREGYVLLDTLRQAGNQTPLFFYANSNAPEHKRETEEHGGQGCTNNGQELFSMVTTAIYNRYSGTRRLPYTTLIN